MNKITVTEIEGLKVGNYLPNSGRINIARRWKLDNRYTLREYTGRYNRRVECYLLDGLFGGGSKKLGGAGGRLLSADEAIERAKELITREYEQSNAVNTYSLTHVFNGRESEVTLCRLCDVDRQRTAHRDRYGLPALNLKSRLVKQSKVGECDCCGKVFTSGD